MNEIEKAINVLKELNSTGHKKFEVVRGTCYAYIEIEPVLKALEQQLNDRWIPVAERLPNRDGNCNVYVTIKHIESGHVFSEKMRWRFRKFQWYNGKNISSCYEVIAWMPEKTPKPFTP
ncbi:MAG: hypothetical protein K0R00_3181 [Herbinix sp.]|nr:hypothetical protein [Herbinix sp.]